MQRVNRKIKVKAGNGMVRDMSTLGPTTRCKFIGWNYDTSQNAFVKTDEVQELIVTPHYIRMVREGSLIAIDDESRKICGV